MAGPPYRALVDSAPSQSSSSSDPEVEAYTEWLKSKKLTEYGNLKDPACQLVLLEGYRQLIAEIEKKRWPYLHWPGPPEPYTTLLRDTEQNFAQRARAWAQQREKDSAAKSS